MKLLKVLALALLAGPWLGTFALAQATNAIQTDIENLEGQTNVLIVKGFGSGGMVSVGGGVLAVHLKESFSPDDGKKLQALVLDYNEGGARQRAIIDYVEIDSLLRGLDYIRTAAYGVTGLPSFEVIYRTRDGFKIIGVGSHRESSVQTYVQFDGCQRVLMDSDQMAQLRNTIAQARNTLDELKTAK